MNPNIHRRQRGAALVIGLLLLAVITLLAIAGMNSASVELVLAGNTQVQAKAFQAAEEGIEQQLVKESSCPAVLKRTRPTVPRTARPRKRAPPTRPR